MASSTSFCASAPLLLQFHTAFVDSLRSFEPFLRGLQIGLSFGTVFHDGGERDGLIRRLRLFHLTAAFLRGGRQIAALQLRNQLSDLHVVTAIHQYTANRRCNFRRDARLVHRIQNGIAFHQQVDGTARRRVYLYGYRGARFAFGFRFLRLTAAHGGQHAEQCKHRQQTLETTLHKVHLDNPCQGLQCGQRHTVAGQSVVIGNAGRGECRLRVHDFQHRRLPCLIAQ